MPELHIGRVRKRYCVPEWAAGDLSRFDHVFQSAIGDELLDAALERAGVPAAEEICIRRVDSIVHLDRSHPDSRLAAAWSIALADAVAGRLREGGPDVVRYPSRFAALVEMACAAARGDLDRVWAWQSLGIWRAGDAIDLAFARAEAVAVLARHACLAAAVLALVARRGVLPLLALHVPGDRWIKLARAALVELAASDAMLNDRGIDEELGESRAAGATATPAVVAAIGRIDRASAIMRAVRASGPPSIERPAARALAALAVLECEPGLVVAEHAPLIVDRLARSLASRATDSAGPPAPTRHLTRVDPPRPESSHPAARDRDDGIADPAPGDDRPRGTTAFGGLLFLLHLVRELDLPASLLRDQALSARSLSWTLYRLAFLLAPVGDGDAAALAFAGLSPLAPAPVLHEPPSTDEEDAALHATRDAIVSALRVRMLATPDEADADLLGRVTARRAEIVADPAWIEARFAVADVSTEVRRAGLDLDPGWQPWLGIVVRFTYA